MQRRLKIMYRNHAPRPRVSEGGRQQAQAATLRKAPIAKPKHPASKAPSQRSVVLSLSIRQAGNGHETLSGTNRPRRAEGNSRYVGDPEQALLRHGAVGVLVDLPDILRGVADRDEHATRRRELDSEVLLVVCGGLSIASADLPARPGPRACGEPRHRHELPKRGSNGGGSDRMPRRSDPSEAPTWKPPGGRNPSGAPLRPSAVMTCKVLPCCLFASLTGAWCSGQSTGAVTGSLAMLRRERSTSSGTWSMPRTVPPGWTSR